MITPFIQVTAAFRRLLSHAFSVLGGSHVEEVLECPGKIAHIAKSAFERYFSNRGRNVGIKQSFGFRHTYMEDVTGGIVSGYRYHFPV